MDSATVQRILRHSSITVTTGTYMRVVEEVRRDALGGMDRLPRKVIARPPRLVNLVVS